VKRRVSLRLAKAQIGAVAPKKKITESSLIGMSLLGHQYLARNNKNSLDYFINQHQKSQPSKIK
jgi:hypothetical protein